MADKKKYILYLDECGDQNLANVNPQLTVVFLRRDSAI